MKLLYAEDDEFMAKFVMRSLLDDLFDIDHAMNGKAALVMFATSKLGTYDACLLDYYMPGMKGDELVEKIRSNNTEIPIIICSTDEDGIQKMMKAGANKFVDKSHSPSEWAKVIKNLVNERKGV